ncbi:hypothetical protein RR48_15353 [Papilio machaon]|uniref:Uncharacterized protein n=1 Tax=Papilio machaon TaxID=76193 RepID=A0A194QUR5_PAPMA|nr:hypothetical protein RR48_15353 [Papilio machaon]
MEGLINKSSSKKSSNILDYGKKQTNKVSVKNTHMNQTTKKSNTENFDRKVGSTVTAINPKQNKNNFPHSTSTNNDKKYSPNIFGEKAGSSKNHGLSTFMPQPTPVADNNYVSSSYKDAKNKKSSMRFGIIWLPTKRRNKLKDNLNHSDGRDRSKERTPSMYKFMSDRSLDQIETTKERDLFASGTLKMTSPVYFGKKTSEQSLDQNHLYYDKYDDQDEREGNEAGGSNTSVNGAKEDTSNQETNADKKQSKGEDVVDKVNVLHRQSISKEQTADSTGEKEECIVVWLHYMLQCSDCCIM